jgi:hypothetical protein
MTLRRTRVRNAGLGSVDGAEKTVIGWLGRLSSQPAHCPADGCPRFRPCARPGLSLFPAKDRDD